jgi:hypothetical protein
MVYASELLQDTRRDQADDIAAKNVSSALSSGVRHPFLHPTLLGLVKNDPKSAKPQEYGPVQIPCDFLRRLCVSSSGFMAPVAQKADRWRS